MPIKIENDGESLVLDPAQAQILADVLFSKANRERAKRDTFKRIHDRRRIEKRQRNRIVRDRRNARVERKPDSRRRQVRTLELALKPKIRCWDWVVHDGDIHYACNASSFSTYTKVDAYVHNISGEGAPVKAIGIGTVNLTAMRALESDNVCEIVLHNVLHLPKMPCNGISLARLEAEEVSMVVWKTARDLQVTEPTGAWMFCGTREGNLHRVAIHDDVGRASTLDRGLRLRDVSLCASDPERIATLGEAERKIHAVKEERGFRIDTGPHTKVEC